MHIKIEKNVPLPADMSRRQSKYPWHEMEVGDSIFLQGSLGVRDRLSASSRQFAKTRPEFAFIMRKEGDGYRVWRVAPKASTRKVVTPKFAGGAA